ncbi:GNAT family N-acetyltransferase [Stappia indica]|uniref:GNAT family N-acetyltransferase n=1 Tax=Stappia indica TaxID=538381 RepID=UPI00082A1F91|nr:GNAT family N-acetyltransferase [Stappia indica]
MNVLSHVRPGDELSATRIYAEALIQKLRPFFGTADAAAEFLAPHLQRDRGVSAVIGDRIVGIAGYRLDGHGLFEPKWRHFRERFSVLGTAIRVAGLALLEKEEDEDVMAMDGIAVTQEARGAGVGRALLAEILDIARRAGKRAVRLDVIDTNPRAKALYLRCGFVEEGQRRLDLLRPVFGFNTVTTMRHHLGDTAAGA